MDVTLRFVELVNGPTTNVDLTEGWLLLAAHATPDLDLEEQRSRLDALAAECTEPTVDGLRQLLFHKHGFAGATADYYAPANSLLDKVLDQRSGIPISLAALMIEVGRRAGVPLDGVGMPGHFLVRDRLNAGTFIDAFNRAAPLDGAGCKAMFHALAGPDAPFDRHYLDPVSTVSMLCRMAANLVNAYRRADDRSGLRWSARLRSRCPGVSGPERVQLAGSLARAGAFDEAAALLDDAATVLGAEEAESSRHQAMRHRARLN